MKMMNVNVVFLCLVLTSLVTGAMWSPPPPHGHQLVIVKDAHQVVVLEFQEQREGKTKVLISQDKDSAIGGGGREGRRAGVVEDAAKLAGFTVFRKCGNKLLNVVWGKAHEVSSNFKDHAKEALGKVDEAEVKSSEKGKTIGEKAREVAGTEKITMVDHAIDMVGLKGGVEGALKDNVEKMAEWDVVDSPKRIGEDIERNVSRKVEQGAEEVKVIRDDMVSLEKIGRVMGSWCHLVGFSTAYGTGVWVTLVLGKCVGNDEEFGMMVKKKMYMVYFRAMAYCVGASLVGYVVSQGLWNKMGMFQGFNLVSSLLMILTNIMFLEPRATKLEKGSEREKLIIKKLNAYSSTLNVWTMVVLTWHLAYVGQLLQARH